MVHSLPFAGFLQMQYKVGSFTSGVFSSVTRPGTCIKKHVYLLNERRSADFNFILRSETELVGISGTIRILKDKVKNFFSFPIIYHIVRPLFLFNNRVTLSNSKITLFTLLVESVFDSKGTF